MSPDFRMMEVEVTPGSPFKAGVPKALFEAPRIGGNGGDPSGWPWDVTSDNQRFIFNRGEESPTQQIPPITVVTNWQSSLKK
jgi:hypothetical protein